MITTKSSTSIHKNNSRRVSSRSASETDSSPNYLLYIYGFLFVALIVALIVYLVPQPKKSKIVSSQGYNDARVVRRFRNLMDAWNKVAADPTFLSLAKQLMDTNSRHRDPNTGVKDIYVDYMMIDQYFKSQFQIVPDFRVTLIYTDGIVFYDSAMDISQVYFMINGLPKPVNLSTLGSPLKDHNVLPEVLNSLSVNTLVVSKYDYMGFPLKDPLYATMIDKGFGFVERMSSSMDVPYSYVARTVAVGVDGRTGYTNGLTLRVSMPVA